MGRVGRANSFFEDAHGSASGPPADEQIKDAQGKQTRAEGADVTGFDAEFRGNVHVGEEEHAACETERADPEGDGEHEHEAHDVDGMEAPGAVEAIPHGGAAEQRAEVVADGRTGKGYEADAGKGQTPMNGPHGEPVVAHENGVVDDDEHNGKNKLPMLYVENAVYDFFHAVALELVVEKASRPAHR